MLHCTIGEGPFRLIGIGASDLAETAGDDLGADLLDPSEARGFAAERVADEVRKRFGRDAITLGRGFGQAGRDLP